MSMPHVFIQSNAPFVNHMNAIPSSCGEALFAAQVTAQLDGTFATVSLESRSRWRDYMINLAAVTVAYCKLRELRSFFTDGVSQAPGHGLHGYTGTGERAWFACVVCCSNHCCFDRRHAGAHVARSIKHPSSQQRTSGAPRLVVRLASCRLGLRLLSACCCYSSNCDSISCGRIL